MQTLDTQKLFSLYRNFFGQPGLQALAAPILTVGKGTAENGLKRDEEIL